MESKIFIDINYSSRMPQIAIVFKDSDDPRDKLISMLTGEAMPGTNNGFCRIERYVDRIVVTPVGPVDMLKLTPAIARLAEENAAIDTSGVRYKYLTILETEYQRLTGVPILEYFKRADNWAVLNLPPDLYKKWSNDVMYGKQTQQADTTEQELLDRVNSMCEQSLDPEAFERWEGIKRDLKAVRKNLK